MNDLLKKPINRPKEKSWQQMGIMLPILRQNQTKNIIRNDHLDMMDEESERLNREKVLQRTLHSPNALTNYDIHN